MRNLCRFCILLLASTLFGCGSCPINRGDPGYGNLYIRTVDAVTGTPISARAVSACDGLALGETLTPIAFSANSYWTKGKVLSIVVHAPGYIPNWQIVKLEKWSATKEGAVVDGNVVLIRLQPAS